MSSLICFVFIESGVVIELALIDQWVTTRLGSTVCWNHLLMRCKSHTRKGMFHLARVCSKWTNPLTYGWLLPGGHLYWWTCVSEHNFASILKLLPSSWYPLGQDLLWISFQFPGGSVALPVKVSLKVSSHCCQQLPWLDCCLLYRVYRFLTHPHPLESRNHKGAELIAVVYVSSDIVSDHGVQAECGWA